MTRQRPHGGGLGLGWDLVPRLSYEGFTASISPATGSVGCGRGDGMPVSAFRFPQTGCASHPVSAHRWTEPRLDSKKLTALQCLPETPAGGGRPPCIHGPRSQPSGGLSVTSAPIWNLLPAEAPSAAVSFPLFLSGAERLPLHSGHSSRPQFPFQGRNAAHISRARASRAGLGRGGGGGRCGPATSQVLGRRGVRTPTASDIGPPLDTPPSAVGGGLAVSWGLPDGAGASSAPAGPAPFGPLQAVSRRLPASGPPPPTSSLGAWLTA